MAESADPVSPFSNYSDFCTLSELANLTVRVKFVSVQLMLPFSGKFGNSIKQFFHNFHLRDALTTAWSEHRSFEPSSLYTDCGSSGNSVSRVLG